MLVDFDGLDLFGYTEIPKPYSSILTARQYLRAALPQCQAMDVVCVAPEGPCEGPSFQIHTVQLTISPSQDERILLGDKQQGIDFGYFQTGPVWRLATPQFLTALLENFCPKPTLDLSIASTE